MIGREGELRRILDLADTALAGERTVLFVEGPIGIGKTALVTDAARRLPGEVIRTQASDTSGALPFHGLKYLIERVHDAPLEQVLDDAVSAYDIARRCVEFLDSAPVTLIIDDVHWIDDPSLQLLERMLATPVRAGGLMVLVHRPDQLPPRLVEAVRRSGVAAERLEVRGLSDAQLREMLSELDDDGASAVAFHAAGNPLFARLLSVAWQQSPGDLQRVLEPANGGSAPNLFDTVRRDIETLPADALAVLQALAVTGRMHQPLLEAITGLDAPAVAAAVAVLRDQRVLSAEAYGAEVMHPVIRSTAYASAPAEWIVAAHRQVVAHGDDMDSFEVHEHLARLGDAQSAEEVEAVVNGAEPFVGRTPGKAAEWLRSTRHRADARRDILLARALVVSGTPEEAVGLLRPLIDHDIHQPEARQLLAHALRMLGRGLEGLELLADSADIDDPALQIERITLALMHEDQLPVAVDDDIIDRVAALGPPYSLGIRSLRTLGLLNAGDVPGARVEFEGVPEGLLEMPAETLREIIDTVSAAGWAAYALDDFSLAIRIAHRGIRVAERYGCAHVLAHLKTQLAFAYIHTGQLREADAAADDAVRDAALYSTVDVTPMALTAKLFSADWRQDREQALATIAAIEAEPPSTVAWWRRTTESAVARISTLNGVPVTSPVMDDVGDALGALRHLDYATVAMFNGEMELAQARFRRAREEAARSGLRSQLAFVDMLEARMLAARMGPSDELIAQVSRAAASFAELGMPHRRAMALQIEDELRKVSAERATGALTARETEIAQLVASGESNQQIAARLGISRRTAEEHVSNILRKLDVSSRAAVGQLLSR